MIEESVEEEEEAGRIYVMLRACEVARVHVCASPNPPACVEK